MGNECTELSDSSGIELGDKMSELKALSNNKEYQRLLPGYLEYWQSRPTAEEPYLHGTGSYALKRILKDGIKPRAGESSITGESALLSLGPKDYVSLATPSRDGEIIATTYAYTSSGETGLSYNADEYFQKDRVTRTIEAIGGKNAFIERVLESVVQEYGIQDVGEMRKTLEFETGVMFESALQYGAYVFKPEESKRRIDALKRIQGGKVTDINVVHQVLFLNGIFQGQREEFIKDRLSERNEEGSVINNQINTAIRKLDERMVSYETLPKEEKVEIENQFPVVIMLEGKEENIVDPKVPLLQERVATKTIRASAIREIRVPQKYVPEVQEWLEEDNLPGVKVTPLEFYEIHEVVEGSH